MNNDTNTNQITIDDVRNFVNSFDTTVLTRSNAILTPEQIRPFDVTLATLWDNYLSAQENLGGYINSRCESR